MAHIMSEYSQNLSHQSSKMKLLKASIIMIHLTHGFRCYSLLLLFYLIKVARFELVARYANARHGRTVTAIFSSQIITLQYIAYKAIQKILSSKCH